MNPIATAVRPSETVPRDAERVCVECGVVSRFMKGRTPVRVGWTEDGTCPACHREALDNAALSMTPDERKAAVREVFLADPDASLEDVRKATGVDHRKMVVGVRAAMRASGVIPPPKPQPPTEQATEAKPVPVPADLEQLVREQPERIDKSIANEVGCMASSVREARNRAGLPQEADFDRQVVAENEGITQREFRARRGYGGVVARRRLAGLVERGEAVRSYAGAGETRKVTYRIATGDDG